MSCALPSREGTCWPVDQGQPDPHGLCRNAGERRRAVRPGCATGSVAAPSSRATRCASADAARGTSCNTPGTCNGLGTCSAPGHPELPPVPLRRRRVHEELRDRRGLRRRHRVRQPHVRSEARTGSSAARRASACRASASTASAARAPAPAPAGAARWRRRRAAACRWSPATRIRARCARSRRRRPAAPTASVTAAAAARSTRSNTVCADETCASNVYTPASMCNASGQCVAPDALPCAPFACNVNKCFTACTDRRAVRGAQHLHQQLVRPQGQRRVVLGRRPSARAASARRASAATRRAPARASPASPACWASARTSPPARSIRRARCADQGGGQLRHQRPLPGRAPASATPRGRRASTRPARRRRPVHGAVDVQRRRRLRDAGRGRLLPVQVRHERVQGIVHRRTPTASRPRSAPTARAASSRRARPASAPQECLIGFCEQGVCCQTACTGICKSCALTASRGTCTNKAPGDTDARCADMGPASCGTDGLCDGNGACRLYDASTIVRGAVVPGQSVDADHRPHLRRPRRPARRRPAIACAPYVCNGTTACKAACTGDGDCLAPTICDLQTNRCGNKKRLGQACTATDQCLTGNSCVDGVCCSSPSCGLCQACNVRHQRGQLRRRAARAPPSRTRCARRTRRAATRARATAPGACQQAAATRARAERASCTGSTFTPVSHCNGSRRLRAGDRRPAARPTCAAARACRTQLHGGQRLRGPVHLPGNGAQPKLRAEAERRWRARPPTSASAATASTASAAAAPSCPTCQACNLSGSAGVCAFMPAGTRGAAGTVRGGSAVRQHGRLQRRRRLPAGRGHRVVRPGRVVQRVDVPAGVVLLGRRHVQPDRGDQLRLVRLQHQQHLPHRLHGGRALREQQRSTARATATTPGSCVAKKTPGAACGGGHECGSGFCTDGVCCTTSGCADVPVVQRHRQRRDVRQRRRRRRRAAGSCAAARRAATPAPARHRRLPASRGRRRRAAPRLSCTGSTFQPASFCSGGGHVHPGRDADCGAYQSAARRRLPHRRCTARRRLRERLLLHAGTRLRLAAARRRRRSA